jgi:hypothetical protein
MIHQWLVIEGQVLLWWKEVIDTSTKTKWRRAWPSITSYTFSNNLCGAMPGLCRDWLKKCTGDLLLKAKCCYGERRSVTLHFKKAWGQSKMAAGRLAFNNKHCYWRPCQDYAGIGFKNAPVTCYWRPNAAMVKGGQWHFNKKKSMGAIDRFWLIDWLTK